MDRVAKKELPRLLKEPVYILLVNESDGRRFSLRVTPKAIQLTLLLLVAVVVAFVMALNTIGVHYDGPVASASKLDNWESRIQNQRAALDILRRESYYEIEGVALRIQELQAGLENLDSMGQRVFEEAGIAAEDFDIRRSRIGGIGGLPPTDGTIPPIDSQEIEATVGSMEEMDELLRVRERQLQVLRSLVLGAKSENPLDKIGGRPVTKGWISSGYGKRDDPITGAPSFHAGMDFGARYGADIVATGFGVVTHAGRHRAYGNYVEISHGRGLTTLYAHAGSIDVSPGDVVEKGQVIGKVGDTGRTTGPHVHYEVIRDGKRLNPWKFINAS